MGNFGSRRLSAPIRLVVVAAMCGIGIATTAPAAAASAGSGDPPGTNGTVKIDGVPFDDGINNEPHVGCQFQVTFHGFDLDQHATLTFSAQPPTTPRETLLTVENVVISTTPAAGAARDPDKTFTFSDADLGLSRFTPQPQQGYHVKLVVDILGSPGYAKQKVFWVQPCVVPTSPSSSISASSSVPPSSSTPPGGNGGNGGGNGGLPITGPAAGGIALGGLVLLGAGTTLLILRRRGIKFTA